MLGAHHCAGTEFETEDGILQADFKVEKIIASRQSKRGQEHLVRWKGYNFLGDTWEPEDHIHPPSKVIKFNAIVPVTVDVKWVLGELRESVRRRMTSRQIKERGPMHRARMSIPSCAHPELSRALVHLIKSEFSPRSKVEDEGKGEVSIELWGLDEIADLVALHAGDNPVGIGNLRIKCGAASHEDMMMIIPPFKLYGGGRECKYEVSATTFNGTTGRPRWAAIADTAEQHSSVERNAMVDHAKLILSQTWTTYPIRHRLQSRGWHTLPSQIHWLTGTE